MLSIAIVFIIVSPFLPANIRVFCETTKFWEEFLLHAQAVTVAIFINVRKTALSDCLPIFFRLPCPPLAKRGSLTHSQALALSKRARDVTAPPVALNRCALRLAGHQSPRQFFVRDGTAGGRLAKTIGCAGWDRLAESGASEVSPGYAGWDRRGEFL